MGCGRSSLTNEKDHHYFMNKVQVDLHEVGAVVV